MKIREILRSDLIYIPGIFEETVEENTNNPGVSPYPIQKGASDDFTLYLMGKIHQKEKVQAAGQNFPWECFVVIPQGNVTKGFAEVAIEQNFYGQPRIICRILHFGIDTKSRNRGLAKILMKEIVRFAAAWGAQAIEVSTPAKSPAHAFWARNGARTYSVNSVFAKKDWSLFTEGDFEWACDHMQEEWQIGSSEIKTPKVQPESTETSPTPKIALVSGKG